MKSRVSTGRRGRKPARIPFFLALLPLLAAGCATLPPHYVPVLPAPVTSFPPVKPGMVRLPVIITFPGKSNLLQHFSNLFIGGLQKIMPDPRGMPGLHLKTHISDLWATMQEPIYLDKGLWLLIQPGTLSVGMMRTDLKKASTVHSVLEMTALPEIIFGPKPLTHPLTIPTLQKFQKGPGIFQAMSNTRISYKEANQYFRDPRLKIIGRVVPGSGERKLTLEGIRLYGSGGQVIVEVKLEYSPLIINLGSKPAKLTVYLRGTPRYLPKQQVFDMPDLDYDIKSSDLMIQIADWMLKSDFRDELRRTARIPIGRNLDVVKGKIDKALNRPLGRHAYLHTQVNSFKVLDGFADNEGIEVRLSIEGAATLEVTWY
jgi:hypothetical protein